MRGFPISGARLEAIRKTPREKPGEKLKADTEVRDGPAQPPNRARPRRNHHSVTNRSERSAHANRGLRQVAAHPGHCQLGGVPA